MLFPFKKCFSNTVILTLQALVRGQYSELGIRRAYFFDLIKSSPANTKRTGHDVIMTTDPDLIPRIYLLDALTSEGKEVTHFETEIGPLLKRFFPHINAISSQPAALQTTPDQITKVFLRLILNMIKFNSSYLDADTIVGKPSKTQKCGRLQQIEMTKSQPWTLVDGASLVGAVFVIVFVSDSCRGSMVVLKTVTFHMSRLETS